eukprot:TRINITY_DN14605_c0_g1_i1.p1 TRINITY_DN14605_c0_g1~~TRINITY_DN14605_c0_g1_i1.p1  ORF type:complete len:228 (-),score=4.76 TRINITY_DN14605_c0_g1_i1:32-646(-)
MSSGDGLKTRRASYAVLIQRSLSKTTSLSVSELGRAISKEYRVSSRFDKNLKLAVKGALDAGLLSRRLAVGVYQYRLKAKARKALEKRRQRKPKKSSSKETVEGKQSAICTECGLRCAPAQTCPRCKKVLCDDCSGINNQGCECEDLCEDCALECASCEKTWVCEEHAAKCDVCGVSPMCIVCDEGGIHEQYHCKGKTGRKAKK